MVTYRQPSIERWCLRDLRDSYAVCAPAHIIQDSAVGRYYFNIRDERGFIPDDEGAEYPSLSEALVEAKASAHDLAKQYLENKQVVSGSIEIADESGALLSTLSLAEVLGTLFAPVSAGGVVGTTVTMPREMQRAEQEHLRRKLELVHERIALDAKDVAEEARWAEEQQVPDKS